MAALLKLDALRAAQAPAALFTALQIGATPAPVPGRAAVLTASWTIAADGRLTCTWHADTSLCLTREQARSNRSSEEPRRNAIVLSISDYHVKPST
jgi:hypothetical protein